MGWKLLDSFILSVLLLIGTLLARDSNPLQVVFLVNLLAATFAVICFSKGQWDTIKPARPLLHFIRGFLGVASTACLLWSLQYLHFAEVTAISSLTPALTAVLALWLFGEQKRWRDFIVLIFNLIGVLLILSPYLLNHEKASNQDSWIGILLSLLAVLLLVVYNINLKKIGEQDSVIAQMVFGPLCSALLLLPLMYWWWQPLPAMAWWLLGLYGALLTVKLAARYWSFKQSQLSRLMPLEYSQMLFSAALGYLFLGQSLSALAMVGILVILASSLAHLWHNCRHEQAE